jgi:hypothetical protein
MWARLLVIVAGLLLATPSLALEGNTAAGPIGGTDIRSAQLPPPGLYGGVILLYASAKQYFDGAGKSVPALDGLRLERDLVAPLLLYVPDVQVFGGSIGIAAVMPMGRECGNLFAGAATQCSSGFGDPYVEIGWSRFFGKVRPSKYPGAYPIAEGLSVAFGLGAVLPIGNYSAIDAATSGVTMGKNTFTVAPTVAITYTTPPLIAEGTELSARLYWNSYATNPTTQYRSGPLLDLDFALTEHIGRFQVGAAGYYAVQVADDRLSGTSVPPDGRRAEVLNIGALVAYDMPEYASLLKVKVLNTVLVRNTPSAFGVAVTWVRKLL